MKLQIAIDIRERSLIDCINSKLALCTNANVAGKIDINTEQLELGDIQIRIMDIEGNVIRTLVYERKTLLDIISSISDGRYREQKVRLLATYETRNIAYIIEGDSICQSLSRDNSSVSSAYLNMVYRDNIHVFFCNNFEETSTIILAICSKIILTPKNYIPDAQNVRNTNIADYTSHLKIKSKKSHNITPENCFILQLSQIPTISHVVAKKIAHIYPTMRDLLKNLEKCSSTKDKVSILSSISMVGNKKAKSILTFMSLS